MPLNSNNSAIAPVPAARVIGRYLMYEKIAAGGMATIHFGRLLGAVGFARIVAIKHLHSHRADDEEFVSMFVDEVRVAARIQHPNVASPLDVVLDQGEIFLVMEYIQGDTLSRLLSSARAARLLIPPAVTAAIVSGALRGLHAAHEAVDEKQNPLNIIHRDVSPQNIMVGVDGVGRVLDFGVAKSMYRCQSTQEGRFKGKLSYMAPEQMQGGPLDRRVDLFAAGIVLWESLTHQRLFKFDNLGAGLSMVMNTPIRRPSEVRSHVPRELDDVVMKALERDVDARFQTAREFADAIEGALSLATPSKVGEWVKHLCGDVLSKRAEVVTNIERSTFDLDSPQGRQELLLWQQGPPTPRPVTLSLPPLEKPSTTRETPARTPFSMDVTYREYGDVITPQPPQAVSLRRPRRWQTWAAFAGAMAVSLLIAQTSVRLARRANSLHNSPSSTPTVNRPAAPSITPVESDPASAPAVPQAALPAELAMSAPVGPAGTAPVGAAGMRKNSTGPSGGQRRPKHATTKASAADTASVKKDCSTPYTIDARGIRRVKPYCP